MKKSKKFIGAFAVAVLILCCFVGCADQEKTQIEGQNKDYDVYYFFDFGIHYVVKENTEENSLLPDIYISLIGYEGSRDWFSVPSAIKGIPVAEIESEAFCGASFTNISIPNSVVIIGDSAFANCDALEYASLPGAIKTMKPDDSNPTARIFPGCEMLTEVNYDTAFDTGIPVRENDIVLPDGVSRIEELEYYGENITSIFIPDSVTEIGGAAFARCSFLKTVRLSNNLTAINGLFEGCSSLERIEIPDGVTSIEHESFMNCIMLNEVILPETLEVIGIDAFTRCEQLREIIIPKSVKRIDDWAFSYCTSLEKVVFMGNDISIGKNVFACCPDTLRFYNANGEEIEID